MGDDGVSVVPPFHIRTQTPLSSVCHHSIVVSDKPLKRRYPSDWLFDRNPEEGHISAQSLNQRWLVVKSDDLYGMFLNRATIVREVGVEWEGDNRG